MTLFEAKPNANLKVKNINLDNKEKLRLMELGLIDNSIVKVKKKSMLKKTLLIVFSNSCFTISADMAKHIEVVYG